MALPRIAAPSNPPQLTRTQLKNAVANLQQMQTDAAAYIANASPTNAQVISATKKTAQAVSDLAGYVIQIGKMIDFQLSRPGAS